MKGKKLSEKHKKKISQALRGKPKPWQIGRIPWNKGLKVNYNRNYWKDYFNDTKRVRNFV